MLLQLHICAKRANWEPGVGFTQLPDDEPTSPARRQVHSGRECRWSRPPRCGGAVHPVGEWELVPRHPRVDRLGPMRLRRLLCWRMVWMEKRTASTALAADGYHAMSVEPAVRARSVESSVAGPGVAYPPHRLSAESGRRPSGGVGRSHPRAASGVQLTSPVPAAMFTFNRSG